MFNLVVDIGEISSFANCLYDYGFKLGIPRDDGKAGPTLLYNLDSCYYPNLDKIFGVRL